MRDWWKRRSLKLRLALWYTAVASGILLALTPAVYAMIEHRLHVELDRQLHLDFNLIESHLDLSDNGSVHWRAQGSSESSEFESAPGWFEVWSRDRQLLLRHRPGPREQLDERLPPPFGQGERGYTLEGRNGVEVRVLERPIQAEPRDLILRVFRDESGLHRTLREILIGFALVVPLAAMLSALGGYVMAGRTLAPVGAMAEQARQITSESLSQRLPNPNPHDELGQLAGVINDTLQRLQDSFEALRRFTADASHELRTPLTALRTVGEVGLRNAAEAPALRESIGSMLEEAQRLHDLVDALLFLARVESGRAAPHVEPVHLAELMAEVRERVSVLATEKQQTIQLSGAANLVAHADRLLLHHAVMNILHNAIQYSPCGTSVTMGCSLRDGKAVIEIADEGPGIPPEYREKIFERFFRIDKARSRAEGGTGLGLAIAKLSIEKHGGRIELDNTVAAGAVFRIVLPAGG